jgi:SNF2 family DNA or RNA helicase
LEELWALFDFLIPGFLGDADSFRAQFRIPIERLNNQLRLEALRSAVAPFVLRRMKETVAADLPPKTEIVRPVDLGGDQRELYESIRVAVHDKVRSALRKRGLSASTVTILAALTRLRQLCCDPRLLGGEPARIAQESAKYELLMRLVPEQLAAGRRILIFSQFAAMLGLIAAGLRERTVDYCALTGATADRDRPIRAFQAGDASVFLISLKAGGTGLNLTRADTVIHYDPWWNPAAQDQATDRAHRIGQQNPVFVYSLIAAGSVEERMLELQRRKRRLANAVIAGGGEAALGLGEAEVEHLLSPLEPQ